MQDNIDELCEFMTLDGIHIEDFTDIYVLGHSFAEVDYVLQKSEVLKYKNNLKKS